jgi:ATP-dependent DNA helicase RecG
MCSTLSSTPEVGKMLAVIQGEMSRAEIQQKLGLTDEKHFRERYQQPAVAMELIEMTIPDKPRSSKQKYRLTTAGKHLLISMQK